MDFLVILTCMSCMNLVLAPANKASSNSVIVLILNIFDESYTVITYSHHMLSNFSVSKCTSLEDFAL